MYCTDSEISILEIIKNHKRLSPLHKLIYVIVALMQGKKRTRTRGKVGLRGLDNSEWIYWNQTNLCKSRRIRSTELPRGSAATPRFGFGFLFWS